jgi:DNA-binding transcriptional ArsR family regulator
VDDCRNDSTERLTPADPAIGRTVELLSAIAHPVRLAVLLALRRRGPITAGELQELAGYEQSAMSHQLLILRDARLVETERRGKQVVYRLADEHVAHIVEDALRHVREHDAKG